MKTLTEQEEELLNLIADRDPSLNHTDWFQFNDNLTFICFICNKNIPFGPFEEMDSDLYGICLDFENYVNHGRMHLAKRKIIGFL